MPTNRSTTRHGEHDLDYSEWMLEAGRSALVVTPSAQIEWGRRALESLRRSRYNSPRDVEIVDAFVESPSKPRVFMFCGCSRDRSFAIQFGDDLDDAEREELLDLMFETHMPLLRSVFAAGAQLVVYVDWDRVMLDMIRDTIGRIAARCKAALESESLAASRAKLMRLDLWIATRLTLYCAQPFDAVIGDLLPTTLPFLDRGADRTAKLIAGVPKRDFELELEPCG